MNKDLLSYLVCPKCGESQFDVEAFSALDQEIEQGRIICQVCLTWYRIQNGILDFLPITLRRISLYESFAQVHHIPFRFHSPEVGEENHKLSQIHFFAKDSNAYEEKVASSPYWKALDEVVFDEWIEKNLKPGSLVLDVGCGTGRQTLPLIRRGIPVIGVDISEEMLLLARKKVETQGLLKYVDFIVSDAENIPLKDQIFNGCAMIGTLHHVHRPDMVIKNVARMMAENGVFFSYDPHKSPVRFIFDWIMKLWKLYDEEASNAPLFTEEQLMRMFHEAGIEAESRLSTYLPPHFFYMLNHRANVKLLRLMDSILNRIPFVRKLGGMVIAEGTRVDGKLN